MKTKTTLMMPALAVAVPLAFAGTATASPASLGATTPIQRSVQIRSIDFQNGLIELFNFADADLDLSGWRFCSHDFDQARRYTGSAGLNGVTIEARTSVFIHFNNDAPAGDVDRLNRSDLGGAFATPLDANAYGLQFYFPGSNGSVSFGNSTLIADHLQWNLDGAGVGSAETRTGQAVGQSLWSATGDFIATDAETRRIELVDLSGDISGSPDEYRVLGSAGCIPDVTTDGSNPGDAEFGVPDGSVTTADLTFFVEQWINGAAAIADVTTDGTNPGDAQFGVPDGSVTTADLTFFVEAWVAGCP
ncbi:MAG: GC-type dockerin domain-anchored protein [Planctomycetota bacterium]